VGLGGITMPERPQFEPIGQQDVRHPDSPPPPPTNEEVQQPAAGGSAASPGWAEGGDSFMSHRIRPVPGPLMEADRAHSPERRGASQIAASLPAWPLITRK
jgi:hypothetical protein